ncbi:MAG: hypothetical protein HZB16_04490 [Armatimonadetes bacterium]|nr:hypothetical protein [Armatimonadota bacterium]
MLSAEWPPSEAQVQAWLGRFQQATLRREVVPRRQPEAPAPGPVRPEVSRAAGLCGILAATVVCLLAGLLALLAPSLRVLYRDAVTALVLVALYVGLAVGAGTHDVVLRWFAADAVAASPAADAGAEPVTPTSIDTTVIADAHGLTLRTAQAEQVLAWRELTRIAEHGRDVVLWSEFDEAMRLPSCPQLTSVLSTARNVVSLRRGNDEALLARMERGLSRPEKLPRAARGLSPVGPS